MSVTPRFRTNPRYPEPLSHTVPIRARRAPDCGFTEKPARRQTRAHRGDARGPQRGQNPAGHPPRGKLKINPDWVVLRKDILGHITDRAEEDRFPLTPQRIVHDVRQVMPPDGIVALDNGMYKIWFARNYRTDVANTLLLDNALATMGAGLPSGMMAALFYPGAPCAGRGGRRRLHDEQPGA